MIEFDSNLLFLADGKPICPECSYCCSLCKKPIFDEAIVTVEGTYHSECFKCTNCKERIQGKSFAKTSQGVIYCVECYAERRERKKARKKQQQKEKVLPELPAEAAAASPPPANVEKRLSPDAKTRRQGMPPPVANSAPTSPKRTALNAITDDPGFEAQWAWTEDINQLENNYVRSTARKTTAQHSDDSNVGKASNAELLPPPSASRTRAASSASMMVPPGLRSTAGGEGKQWLMRATAGELREELLVNYGQLCRMEASYQKLKDLYASVIDQLLEAKEGLKQEKGKRAEYEQVLRQNGLLGSSEPAKKKPARGPQVDRKHSLRRQRQVRKYQVPGAAPAEDSGSDGEEAIITTVSQKATKRFIWPFKGAGGRQSEENSLEPVVEHQKDGHSFRVIGSAFGRAGNCDHCQERIKTFSGSVVRCKHCGFVCHQRCVGDVTAGCGAQAAKDQPVYDPNVPFHADPMFGRHLVEQAAMEGQMVPWVVRAAIRFIEQEGILMEGIYRRSGSTMDIRGVQMEISRLAKETSNQFANEPAICGADEDVTSVTSTLKQYLRDLPNPLMTEETYPMWVQAASLEGAEERIEAYRGISESMPRPHAETLGFLMLHLQRVAEAQAQNKMTANNLSVVFAPNLLRMAGENVLQEMANMSGVNRTVSFVIQHARDIF